ncbi:hybrid sensor histidine kinase/response regulator [Opitutus sp. ER46]|uniref:hybrid sensor histidine kinase/response regulator n=1 Tax=Opitutus sp. ER46 TaxID=2161864 RepID=UPI000D2FDAB6|nr:hybrid sensor histidine kinase/response regulator [Opitutus sp. ER46]PTX99067.1 hybrid sensor histidine kinase/response regulator [Opitutus sp. ER46]
MTLPQPPDSSPANILVVDDTAANLHLLASMLKARGYRVRPVSSGEMALRAVEVQTPDLILLDITMPGMNGYEVCSRLKADPRWRDIPVLFISALSGTEDKIRSFQAGGIDYVGKPFQFEEVDARVRTHLELRRHQRELQESYARLKVTEELRDSLTHMIAHDMRSPLLALQMSMELLREMIPNPAPDAAQMMTTASRSVSQLIEMVSQMLDVSRMQAGTMELDRQPTELVSLTSDVLETLRPLSPERRIELSAPPKAYATCDASIIRRVLANLVANALKFTPAPGIVQVGIDLEPALVRVRVRDTGPGIAPEHHQRIFQKFGRVGTGNARLPGTGLGLTFSKMAVEAHGGQIGLTSVLGQGSTFWITLPTTPAEQRPTGA